MEPNPIARGYASPTDSVLTKIEKVVGEEVRILYNPPFDTRSTSSGSESLYSILASGLRGTNGERWLWRSSTVAGAGHAHS